MYSEYRDFSDSVCFFSFVSLICVHNFTAQLDRHSNKTAFSKACSERFTKILIIKELSIKTLFDKESLYSSFALPLVSIEM